ncbi:glucokinase [Deferribacter desulfuricans SSM1]|uniref:Glucokinase n=1 Tax=Deferribacter desulfuricans (strain DSM 14783 / JCM 11476 / NBRC 101012 / SSM1) TaxID=639282 RepID=D3PDX7_DEFDS|nr:ROK family protein [Deferribacter desulfuricans]BAI80800.1 glucokinase [Deferribacter desulfuricans SSM1]
MNVYVFDIGGTNIKYAYFNNETIEFKDTVKTPSSYDELLSLIKHKIQKPYDKVVIGLPAILDYEKNCPIYAPNLTYLTNKNVVSHLNIKNVYLENDANLAAFGEYKKCHHDVKNMLMVTLGTGVGGGLILNGRIVKSKYSLAEIGHIVVVDNGWKCSCGNRGCLEAYCGKNGIMNIYKSLSNNKEEIDSVNRIYQLAIQKKLIAKLTFKQFAHYLAIGVASFVNSIYVEKVVLGGGVSHYSDMFFKDFIKFFNEKLYPPYKKDVIIHLSRLKNDAALYGGYFYAKDIL